MIQGLTVPHRFSEGGGGVALNPAGSMGPTDFAGPTFQSLGWGIGFCCGAPLGRPGLSKADGFASISGAPLLKFKRLPLPQASPHRGSPSQRLPLTEAQPPKQYVPKTLPLSKPSPPQGFPSQRLHPLRGFLVQGPLLPQASPHRGSPSQRLTLTEAQPHKQYLPKRQHILECFWRT